MVQTAKIQIYACTQHIHVVWFIISLQYPLDSENKQCRSSVTQGVQLILAVTVGQGLLPLQQVRVEGECFYFVCFFTFIQIPFSSVPLFHLLYLIFSYISSPFLWETIQNEPQGVHKICFHGKIRKIFIWILLASLNLYSFVKNMIKLPLIRFKNMCFCVDTRQTWYFYLQNNNFSTALLHDKKQINVIMEITLYLSAL